VNTGARIFLAPVSFTPCVPLAVAGGQSNAGSIRTSRARVSASTLSFFKLLSAISRTRWAFATMTSWPSSVRIRATHGDSPDVRDAQPPPLPPRLQS
jgi:hypothetical protein